MNAKTRRMEIDLSTLGTGVILFGLWSFVKFSLTTLLIGVQIDEALSDSQMTVLTIVLWVLSIVDMLIHLYIGLCARADSKGKRRSPFYLILAGILVSIYLLAVILEILSLIFAPSGILTIVISIVIDLTAVIILIEMMVYAKRTRKSRKNALKEDAIHES